MEKERVVNQCSCGLDRFVVTRLECPDSWAATLEFIIEANLLNVSNQETVDKELSALTGEVLVVADGEGFEFEIVTRRGKRRIAYYNIDDHIKYYQNLGIESEDYDKAKQLVTLIQNEFDWHYLAE